MTLTELNTLNEKQLFEELFKCCGSTQWAMQLAKLRPYTSVNDLLSKSDNVWALCSRADFLEAFTHHPRIGDVSELEKKFAATQHWAGNEQSGMQSADKNTIIRLAKGNDDYYNKFGYIFIVCATGKAAGEMLRILEVRLPNLPEAELKIAAEEQNKITHLRIHKLVHE